MKQQILEKSPLLALPLVALFIFLAVFLLVLLKTMLRRRGTYEPLARLPLDDEPTHDEEDRHA